MLFIVFFKGIKTLRSDLSFEIQLWVQLSGVYVLIMAINMPLLQPLELWSMQMMVIRLAPSRNLPVVICIILEIAAFE